MSDAEDTDGQGDRSRPLNTAGRAPGGQFTTGNPGRPKGARNRASRLAQEVLEAETEAIARKAVDLALGGDTTALKIVLDRVSPVPKGRPISVDLPAVETPRDLIGAFASLLAAVAEGSLAPAEGMEVARIAEGLAKAHEVHDLGERVRELEQRLGGAR